MRNQTAARFSSPVDAIFARSTSPHTGPRPVLWRLMPPLAVIIILLVVFPGVLLWKQHQQDIARDVAALSSEMKHELLSLLKQQTYGLTSVARSVAGDINLQKALAAEDVNSLLTDWLPVFTAMRTDHYITHFNFLNSDRVVLLRLHTLEKSGDRVNRATVLQAESSGAIASGIEAGQVGAFPLRVVHPVTANDSLLGYVELGQEISEIVKLMPLRTGLQLAVILNKEFIDRQAWEMGQRLPGQAAEWNFMDQHVLIYNSREDFSGRLADAFNHKAGPTESGREYVFDGRNWHISLLPLHNADASRVGGLLLILDITAEKATLKRLLTWGSSIAVVLLGLLLGFIYILLRRTDATIHIQAENLKQQKNLLTSVRQAQNLFISGHESHLVYGEMLNILVQATGSAYGFLDEVRYEPDGTPYKLSLALSDIAWGDASRKLYAQLVEQQLEFRNLNNLSMAPVIKGQTIIANDVTHHPAFQGLPKGHPPLNCYLGIPIFYGGEIIGVAGVANCSAGYTEASAEFIKPLTDACAAMIWADRIVQREQESLLALRASEAKYRQIAETANEGIWVIDRQLCTTYVNNRMAEILGYEAEEISGKIASNFMFSEDFADHSARMHKRSRGQSEVYERRFRHKNGSVIWTIVSATVVQDKDRNFNGSFAMLTDITASRQLEEERLLFQQHLQQLQKAESLNRMAGAVAHHFNNQLQVVMGNLELAAAVLNGNTRVHHYLDDAMQASHKAAEVSGLMLTYLGQATGSREPLNLSDAIHHSLPMLKVAMSKNVELKTDLPTPGPIVRANFNQLQQILSHLLTNAWEACGDAQGAVALSVKSVPMSAIPASHCFPLSCQPQAEEYACLEIRDNGCGIAPEDMQKLFDPFYSTKFTGRGLGLPAVLGIVKAHKGLICVESELRRQSIFRVFLPIWTEAAPVMSEKATPQSNIEEGGGAILIAEDEEALRTMAEGMLTHLGFTVLSARDGAEAVEIFRQHASNVRCVLCDLTMPRLNGWETLTALRQIRPDIPVILVSGYDQEQVMTGDHPEWPQAFLGKPYKLDALREALAKSWGRGEKPL